MIEKSNLLFPPTVLLAPCDCFNIFIAILERVHKRETMVLGFWALRKRQQEGCMQFVQYESSAKQV